MNGGAFYVEDSSLKNGLNVTSTKFSANKAHLSGGAIFLVNSHMLDINSSKFVYNKALIGGAIR